MVGDGTATSPFTGSTDENIETSAGDMTLSWAGPLKIVTIAYKEAGRAKVLDGVVRAAPALSDGRLFVRDEKRLACVKLK